MQSIPLTTRINMQSAPGTSFSSQLSATPTSEFAFSSSSPAHGGGQGGGRPPPNFPRFNLPDSYWTRTRVPSKAEQVLAQASVEDHIQQLMAKSREGQDTLLKVLEDHQEDRENDPRSRIQGMQFLLDFRPIQVPDLVLSPEILAGLVVLKDPDDAEPQPQSSTSSTSSAAAAATQQNAATGGCCIPPGCNIV